MNKYVLGLDLGVGSVGWAIVNKDDGKIIDKGVRLFSEADPAQNADRRNYRHTRRLLRRKEFRLYRTRRVLLEMGLIDDIKFKPLDNPYQIREKGLRVKLNNDELSTAILHLMKRNGFRYEIADDIEGGQSKIKEDYLCQHQLHLLEESGKVRGINNKYHYSLYLKEFTKLLQTQKIEQKYIDKLLYIFEKRRDYSEGPGSKTSPTKYGRFLSFGAEPINLIEKMRGHCSVFAEELRAPKICPSAELFNFLNDLNNLKIDDRHISTEKKRDIFETYILGKGKITVKQLCDYLGVSESRVDGFRIDSKNKPIITEFKSLKKIKEACKKEGIVEFEIDCSDDLYLLDSVFEILTSSKIIEERVKKLKDLQSSKVDPYINCFSKISGVSMYHSLSFKAIRILINEMFETPKNSQQIIVTLVKEDNKNKQELKLSKDLVISPVVYKSVNQSFKIIKAVTKRYGALDSVVIEMTRSKNSKDEADKIKKGQAARKEDKERVLELIKGVVSNPSSKLIESVLLYLQQDAKSLYSGKSIDLFDLLTNPSKFEVDHIIPYSVSYDDSRNNRVLVYAEENQIKGQRTPHHMFMNCPRDWWSEEEFELYSRQLMSTGKISRRKLDNLLYKKDISSSDAREEFINRNLNDTSYITSEVLKTLKTYYSNNNISTKVFVVNGATTNLVRKLAGLVKDRDYYCHHAVDACIIASFSQSTYVESSMLKDLYDKETGEIFIDADIRKIFGPVAENVASQLISLDPIKDYKFSYKIDSKPNRSLSDQTLYGTRVIDGELRAVKKYKNIYDKDGEKVANIIKTGDKKLESLLIYQNDVKSLYALKRIVDSYPLEKNPFQAYFKEHGDYVRKVSGKGKKAPAIINLKYTEDKINSAMDLSAKYFTPVKGKGSPVKLQLSPYRMDLYISKDGYYKFITIRYANVRFKNNEFQINKEWYENEKSKKGITNEYRFVNTFYRGDLIKILYKDGNEKFEVFKTVNSDLDKKIENSYFGRETKKENSAGKIEKFQNMLAIGKNVIEIKKYTTDILGNIYLSCNERLKLSWK